MPLVNKAFADLISFTRASAARYFDANGVMQSASNNVPRFDYDPVALTPRGLLIEEQRTNSIRNNTMVGAVAGAPGTLPTNWSQSTVAGLTREVVGTGTDSGITYIDLRFSGTATSTGITYLLEPTTQVATLVGEDWTSSAYLAVVGGSTTNCTSITVTTAERNSSGGLISVASTNALPSIGATLRTGRYSATRTIGTAGYVTPQISINVTNGAAIDITLRIGLPQLERGAFATSAIATSGTAATRSADSAVINTLSPWFNASAGTLFVEAVTYDTTANAFARAVQLNDGTLNNVIQIARNNASGAARMSVTSGGVSQAAADATAWTLNAAARSALAYAENDFAIVANGGAAATDTSGSVPSVTTLRLGAAAGPTGLLNGWLRRVSYYPRRLSNAELQSITA